MGTKTITHGSEYWKLHEDGAIERPGLVRPDAKAWRIVGAVRRNNFGVAAEAYTLADILRGGIQWRHANGAQRVFVRDMDHGTLREWRTAHSID